MTARHIYLSPHFDDAVFSCGGQIAQLARRGDSVAIYTVMAGDPPEGFAPTAFTDELHARWGCGMAAEQALAARRAEDRAAAAVLGASLSFGSFADAIYRVSKTTGTPLYASSEAIFSDVHPDDPATPEALEQTFLTIYPQLTSDVTLYAPLGVGHHVDHQLVRAMALRLAARFRLRNAYFYEDFPYARNGEAVRLRAVSELAQALRAHPEHFGFRVVPHRVVIDDEALARKIKASTCYRSQVSSFWADLNDLERVFREYHALSKGELCYRPQLRGED
ncbi:MAG: PIG-L family deacetylase [Anaerolineae bacterium]|nr:PIG-L family deacetylase [Anaerolineae bacterium]